MDDDEAFCYHVLGAVCVITLITGAPGAGKSAALVDLLSQLTAGRPLYVDGVPDLKVEHQPLPDPTTWPATVPDGSAIVIDEVQRVWRPRGPGAKVPDHIAALETHRHRGLDFFIVTQGPRLVDGNVRALVGRHVHLRDLGVLGRWWYEWPECSEAVAWKSAPIKKRYRLPKAIFDKYRSASMHIKPIRSFPMALVWMIGALLALAVLVFMGYRSITGKTAAMMPSAEVVEANKALFQSSVKVAALTAEELYASFKPRFPDDPGSAPAFDAVRPLVVAPRIVGGYCVGDVCYCMTQQGTDAGLTRDRCYRWIHNRPFDPYVAAAPETARPAWGAAVASAPSVQ